MSDGPITAILGFAPLWGGFLALIIWMVRTWPYWKQRVTEARIADDQIVGNQWKRFQEEIDRLVGRVTTLETKCGVLEREVQECRERETRERAGRLEAEAMLLAQGRARQEAQRIVSDERNKDQGIGNDL